LKQTIRLNNLENVLIPIKKWVGEKMIKASISERGNESSIGNDTWSTEEIEITTIDQFTKENQINVWLIKWDVEGQELGSIRWAEATIKQFKPILLISIYHTWKDFFEIKPLLESRNLWYIYKVINANPFHPYYETMLIAY
jgi:FkbM family methyltransferase